MTETVYFKDLSEADLERLADRAYREAARSWRDVTRAKRDPEQRAIVAMLVEAAESADQFYQAARDALRNRRSAN